LSKNTTTAPHPPAAALATLECGSVKATPSPNAAAIRTERSAASIFSHAAAARVDEVSALAESVDELATDKESVVVEAVYEEASVLADTLAAKLEVVSERIVE